MHNAFFNLCAARVHRRVCSVASSTKIMVEQFPHITSELEEQMRRCQYVPRFSFGRRMLRDDAAPNRF